MVEAKSLRKALIPPSLLPDPSPGHLQSTRLALHLNDGASSCSAFVASACRVYKIEMRLSKKAVKAGQSSRSNLGNIQASTFPNEGASGSRAQKSPRTPNWTEALDACFLSLLTEEHTLGNNVNGSFTNLAWVRVVSELNTRNGLNLNKEQVKNRMKVLKRTFALYHCLANKSGWGWDFIRHIPTAGDGCDWDSVILENPAYAKCRDRPFPLYREMEFLTQKTTATGAFSLSSLHPATTTIVSSSSSSPGSSGPNINEFMESPPVERSPSPRIRNKTTSGSGYSSAGKRQRSPVPEPSQRTNRPSTGGRRKKNEGITQCVEQMLQLGKERLDLVRHAIDKDTEGRAPIPPIDVCLQRLYKMQGLNDDQVLAAADAFKDVQNRQIFMSMNDDLAFKWAQRQIAKDIQMYRQFFPGP